MEGKEIISKTRLRPSKGYEFIFNFEGKEIRAWYSFFSGLEKVFLDDKEIISQRNVQRVSKTTFEIDGSSYHTELNILSSSKGPFECSLFKNEELIKKQIMHVNKEKMPTSIRFSRLILMTVLAVIGGLLMNYFNLEFYYIFLVAITSVLITNQVFDSSLTFLETEEVL